ncbi:type II toxin-antitoxin system PemK/MazF family toxin [Candidatus Woesearchaeota archaeon]|nr:type II toxin-antitoxin system PemK/MazF family toxin [Candidatus Woesearchaeota archaeon]
MNIKRGDIVLVNLDPVKGSEQGKIRPALIIQNNIGNEYSPITIIALITSKIFSKEFPTNVQIKTEDSGLEKESTILLNQIRAIDKSRIIKRLKELDSNIMKKVDIAIKISLDLV